MRSAPRILGGGPGRVDEYAAFFTVEEPTCGNLWRFPPSVRGTQAKLRDNSDSRYSGERDGRSYQRSSRRTGAGVLIQYQEQQYDDIRLARGDVHRDQRHAECNRLYLPIDQQSL